ncbi:MAG: RebB family R body protein [Lentisphaeraceae bacterium]|nr:RebB family R body protein [Lentisphaeraceae bacterium]
MPHIPEDIVQAVAIGNLKSISEQPAMLSNLAYSNTVANTNLSHQNAVSNQQSLNELGITVLGRAVNTVANIDPMEARSANHIPIANVVSPNMRGVTKK